MIFRNSLTALFFICALGMSFAQNTQLGLKLGLNSSSGDILASGGGTTFEFDTKSRQTIYLGGFAEIGLSNDKTRLQFELVYSQNGIPQIPLYKRTR